MRVTILLGAAFAAWLVWASCSSGGLYELKQINPDFAHPNRHVAYLVSKLNRSEGHWDSFHVEQCSPYMPNWEKAERCVLQRLRCELGAPTKTDAFGTNADVFSDAFRDCYFEGRPFFGPAEWLRVSRVVPRLGVAFATARLVEGSWLEEPLMKWLDESQ